MSIQATMGWLFGPHFFDIAAILCIGIGVSMALSSEPKDVSAALWFFGIAALLAAGRAGHWLVTTESLPAPRYILAPVLFAAIGLIWISAHLWAAGKLPQPQLQPRIRAEVRSAFVSDSGPLTVFMVRYNSSFGNTTSPILYLAYIQITNLQDAPIVFNDIKIAAGKDPTGPWEDLIPIDLQGMTMFELGPPVDKNISVQKIMKLANGTYRLGTIPPESYMKMARMVAVSPTLLEVEMAKPIDAHASIWGWVALDSLRHVGLTPGQIYFRIKLRDSSNKEDSPYVIELPRKQPDNNAMDINCGAMLVTNVTADISGDHLKYYSDPFTVLPSR